MIKYIKVKYQLGDNTIYCVAGKWANEEGFVLWLKSTPPQYEYVEVPMSCMKKLFKKLPIPGYPIAWPKEKM